MSFSPILGADLLCLSSRSPNKFSSSLESCSSNSCEFSELSLCLVKTGCSTTGNYFGFGKAEATGATGATGVIGGIVAAGVCATVLRWDLVLGEVKGGGELSVFKADTVCWARYCCI